MEATPVIAIFSQDGTWVHNDAEEAKARLLEIYGEKLGQMAYDSVKRAPVGTAFRRNGGPLVQVVDKEKAAWIREKEAALA
jgi:hypothetical protein